MLNGVTSRFWHDEGGAAAATYALALIGLMAVGGVGFDYARMAGMDSELQNAADQAALAGASQLDGNSGACARAAGAANALVSNQTLLATGDDAVTIPLETGCDATGQIRFWQDKDKTTAATNDENANFVEVFVNARSVDYALLPITGLLRSDDIQGIALAGLGSAICKVPPVMMCNPRETSDPGFDVSFYTGKGIRLIANDGGGYTPGNFGYLETNAGNGAIATARTLGRTEVPGDCVATDDVTTKPGEQISVLDALNTRHGIYANGLNNVCGTGDADCPPSANAKIDLVQKGGNCSLGNSGFQVGPNPYRPTSSTANIDPTGLDPMGYPRDKCHAVSKTGSCILDRVGDGEWDRNAYYQTNGQTAPSTASFGNYGYPELAALPASRVPTRYQQYRYDYQNAATNLNSVSLGGGLSTQGGPLCNGPGIAPGSSPDRRVLSIAVINCSAEGVIGKTPGVDVEDWVDVFLVEPSATRGNGASTITEKSDVYVEVIGRSTLGGGGTQGQEIRKDVPYLVE